MKTFLKKYKHAWVFLYGLIYLPWFFYLEQHVTTKFHVIHTPLDDKIPFIEYFIVPYMLWFAFIAVTIGYFFFCNTNEFLQTLSLPFHRNDDLFDCIHAISKWSVIKTGYLCQREYICRYGSYPLCYRHADEYSAEYSCVQFPWCLHRHLPQSKAPGEHADPLRLSRIDCTDHFINNVLKTALCYRCTSRRCDGRCDVCSRIYEGTQ